MKRLICRFWQMSFLLAALTACEDILDKYPEDEVTPETYFNTEEDLELFTNSFYANLVPGDQVYQDRGDILITQTLSSEILGNRVVPQSGGGWSWTALRQINFYLENSSRCTDEDARKHYDGVARYFRAYFYFDKVRQFGDVPWYDRTIGSADTELLTKPRDSRELVMQNVLADLNYAIDNLRDEKDVYRITRWTALAMKSRICLFEGTFRKYHGITDWEKYLDEAAKAAETFMNESGYTLYTEGDTPYQDLFASVNAQASEIILARDYNQALGLTHVVQAYEISTGMGCHGVTKRLVDSYLMKNGQRFTEQPNYGKMTFTQETADRDPRMAQTIITPQSVVKGTLKAPNMKVAHLGYQPLKYYIGTNYDTNAECDLPIIRTAEVYLNFAEAKAELGTLTQDDINKSIKLLRDRVGMPNLNMEWANNNPDPWLSTPEFGYPNVQGDNKGVILEIRRERTIELFMESFRYYDLMRWKEGNAFTQDMLGVYFPGPGGYDLDGDGTNDVSLYTTGTVAESAPLQLEIGVDITLTEGDQGNVVMFGDVQRVWDENKDYLSPIPITDRMLTNGALTQNPGWDDGLEF